MSRVVPRTCRTCGGTNLRWSYTTLNMGQAPDGRIFLCEVEAVFFLGCGDCSATLMHVAPHQVCELLNVRMKEAVMII